MLWKKPGTKNTDKELLTKLLTFIVAHTQSAAGMCYAPEKELALLNKVQAGLIEVNPAMKDAQGQIAVKATATGIAEIAALTPAAPPVAPAPVMPAPVAAAPWAQPVASVTTPTAPVATAPKEKPVIFRNAGIALPEIQRGGGLIPRESVYPFAALAAPVANPAFAPGNGQPQFIYDSFAVVATEANPHPAKKLASTVSSATKRFKNATNPALSRKFAIRTRSVAEETGAGLMNAAGARIWRIQ